MTTRSRSYRLTLGPEFNEGARQVWMWLRREGKSQSDLLRLLDAPGEPSARGLLPRWLFGDRRPGAVWARRIEVAIGVMAGLWGEKPRREFVPPARTAAAAELRREALKPTGT